MFEGKKEIEKILNALAQQLAENSKEVIEMVVCGGAALNAVGYIERTTNDIDVIAFIDKNKDGETVIYKATPMKPVLLEAAKKVQRDFNLIDNWLNDGPASVMDFGLPAGLMDRVQTHKYYDNLIVHFLSRYDQIHFKLYATVDLGAGTHYDDLLALNPTSEELESAARWSMTHDPSDGYKLVLKDLLIKMDFKDVAERL